MSDADVEGFASERFPARSSHLNYKNQITIKFIIVEVMSENWYKRLTFADVPDQRNVNRFNLLKNNILNTQNYQN